MEGLGKWTYNLTDDGQWSGEEYFETKEEAIEYVKEHFGDIYEEEYGEQLNSDLTSLVFYVGKIGVFEPYISASTIIEQLQSDAYYKVGDLADGYLENIKKEDLDNLEQRLNIVLSYWIKSTKNEANFFTIKNVERIVLSTIEE